MTEFSQYNVLKDAVRAKLTRQSSRPDAAKIKKDVSSEMRQNFEKNNCSRHRFELTYQKFNSAFHFSVTKSHARRCVTRHGKKENPRGRCSVAICLPCPGKVFPVADKARFDLLKVLPSVRFELSDFFPSAHYTIAPHFFNKKIFYCKNK